MKTIKILLFILLSGSLQAQINQVHNSLRTGDQIVKQQMESADPGKAGKNVIWDFSRLKTINDEYKLEYTLPPLENGLYVMGHDSIKAEGTEENELIVGHEHYTMYYYRLHNNMLYQLGHENPVSKIQYKQPLVLMNYPMNFGQEISSEYTAQGTYSSNLVEIYGTITTIADGYGSIKLPTGEVHDTSLRVKSVQITTETLEDKVVIKKLEKYNWYVKGYRYPIFEIVKNIDTKDDAEIFSTSFYFPPQEHHYLDTDPENLALLEELWDMDNIIMDEFASSDNKIRLYPNPVESLLEIEYKVDQRSPTVVQIFSTNGMLLWKSNKRILEVGTYKENVDCSKYIRGLYIVKVVTDYGINTKTLIKNQ